MADFNSDSSSKSSIIVAQEESQSLRVYQFEPRKDSVDSSSSSSDNSSDSSEENDEQDVNRLVDANTPPTCSWCQCTNCSTDHLKREKECVCCAEKAAFRSRAILNDTDGSACVGNNTDFITLSVCCTPVVLRNVLVGLNIVRADNWEVNPPQHSGLRYAAYRQFSWWVHGKLGPSRRRVIRV